MQRSNTPIKNKDFQDKGQKISAALYLMTNHLSDSEPLKGVIRSHALALHTHSSMQEEQVQVLCALLKTAAIAKVISESNVLIVIRELTAYVSQVPSQHSIGSLFVDQMPTVTRTANMSINVSSRTDQTISNLENKHVGDTKIKRQDQILTFINGRKSAVIKDISGLFPEVSEKTIQRELGALVDAGKIAKRGSKRWSIYMAMQ